MIERNKQKNTAGKPKGYRAWNKGMTLDSSYRKRISEGTKIGMAKPETKEKMKLYYKRFKDSGMFKGDNNPYCHTRKTKKDITKYDLIGRKLRSYE
jgi:hypothetical protein